jgi:hypothetical protein
MEQPADESEPIVSWKRLGRRLIPVAIYLGAGCAIAAGTYCWEWRLSDEPTTIPVIVALGPFNFLIDAIGLENSPSSTEASMAGAWNPFSAFSLAALMPLFGMLSRSIWIRIIAILGLVIVWLLSSLLGLAVAFGLE